MIYRCIILSMFIAVVCTGLDVSISKAVTIFDIWNKSLFTRPSATHRCNAKPLPTGQNIFSLFPFNTSIAICDMKPTKKYGTISGKII